MFAEGEEMKTREFGVRLTQYRERARLSISELARRIDVDYMQVSRYEKGQSLPSFENAILLAQVLEVSLDALATGSEPEPPAFENKRLFKCMRELDQIPADRQELALRVLDTVIAGHELESLGDRLRRS
jgi:transcriptional regulator with XRE-family HTH domain